MATTLTVSWNCKNFLIQSKMFLPYLAAVTILPKLSSSKMIPAAYLAIQTPAIPMAKPISAFFKAGASLPPSPVMATTWPSCLSPVANRYLSSGEERANTLSSLEIALNVSISPTWSLSQSLSSTSPPTASLNYLPVITTQCPDYPFSGLSYPYGIMLASFAMATAVSKISPVTILTIIPACLHLLTASGIPFFSGSLMPANPKIIRFSQFSSGCQL